MAVLPLYKVGLVKIDYEFTLGGRDWHIINWWDSGNPSPLSPTSLHNIVTEAQSVFGPVFAFTTTDTTHVGTTATDWGSDTGGQASVTAGGTGTEDPPTLPIQCAAEISWKIGRRYRGGHPKSFLSGVAEARQTANRLWTSGFTSGLDGAIATMIGNIAGFSELGYLYALVNNSRFTGHAERTSPQLDDITAGVTNPMISSQRRRRGRI